MSATHQDNQEDSMTEMTREQWLKSGAEAMWPMILDTDLGTKPEVYRVSCGWPSKSPLRSPSKSSRRIGECWSDGSEDSAREIFISPALAQPIEVLDVLLHEMIHAALRHGVGHKHPFPRIAKLLGMEGKPTATFAGEELVEKLTRIADKLGRYPHAKLDAGVRTKQTARQMKCECPDCGYVVRVARSWIDVGTPTCVCGTRMISLEYGEGEGMAREPLKLREAFTSYLTEDERFELSTSKRQGREGSWNVVEVESGRLAIRRNREDALAFLGAYRAGEVEFPELDEPEADLPIEDDYLDDDEDEDADFEDIDVVEGDEALAWLDKGR